MIKSNTAEGRIKMENKITVNLHTHTARCNHAAGDEREYILNAISGGLSRLGFSDHSPYCFPADYHSGIRMRNDQVGEYVSTLKSLREEFKDRIDIKIGYEMEYYPKYFSETIKLITEYDVDYLILGQHHIENEFGSPYSGHPTENEKDLAAYVDMVIEAIDTGIYTYIAHPDNLRFVGEDAVFDRHYSRLIEHAKDLDIPLEINCLGIREGRFYPGDRFFSLCGKIGASVCVGSDAHSPETVSDTASFAVAFGMIQKYGLKFIESPVLRKVHFV